MMISFHTRRVRRSLSRVVVNPVDGRSGPAAGRYRSAGQDLIWEAGN